MTLWFGQEHGNEHLRIAHTDGLKGRCHVPLVAHSWENTPSYFFSLKPRIGSTTSGFFQHQWKFPTCWVTRTIAWQLFSWIIRYDEWINVGKWSSFRKVMDNKNSILIVPVYFLINRKCVCLRRGYRNRHTYRPNTTSREYYEYNI